MTSLAEYRHLGSGKVRELYAVDDELLLMVTTDRISAFDWVLPTPIPDRGRILTAMSVFWFDLLDTPHHLVAVDDPLIPPEVRGRAMLVRRLEMAPIECVARGYLTGSALADYRETQSVCGVPLPSGLVEADQLPEPIFTPATKAPIGSHDENISFDEVKAAVGDALAVELRDATLAVYEVGADHAARHGILLADTKIELGVDRDGQLRLADEVLTPDSSRFWPAEGYRPGRVQPSFDKQYVRDWLTGTDSGWDRTANVAPPELPGDVVAATRERYVAAYEQLSGQRFDDWLG